MCNLSDMVCGDEGSVQCIISNLMPGATVKKITLMVRPSNTVSQLFSDIKTQLEVDNFEIVMQTSKDGEEIVIAEHEMKTLSEVGIDFTSSKRTTLKLVPPSKNNLTQRRSAIIHTSEADSTVTNSLDDDELALGASASPVEANSSPIPLPLFSEEATSTSHSETISLYPSSSMRSSCGYVGLVNQAMTCYLNSLLQALYMTPEFRNALYNWEYDGSDAVKNIPYQLQRLFLNLQTSNKMSVETTDLTRSFGWDSTEAWQQHDIQELCRVMFDTLEQKFKGTQQADFINRLYEGKMTDYVKCLECGTDKSREDKFLDIPLPVRPFGSSVAYGSVEEALRAFVEPETLNGTNQYFCEKCNKKCDAHKGLKFSKFPYILTLHLKRFDFDYQTFHRIKLNDKVTFPQSLNLNSFIKESDAASAFTAAQTNGTPMTNCDATSSEHGSVESAIKCDDCSTTDSGSILEEELGGVAVPSSSLPGHIKSELDGQDDDEGIDMSGSAENRAILSNDPGSYNYELFSIMIHSGSASGGHYYAYIKEFENGEWFCFNDQNVSPINQEAIEKSYGGGASSRSFYSSAYSSSTNAYMLMYRQVDPQRNVSAIKQDEFPEHIKQLQDTLKDDASRKSRYTDTHFTKYKVHWIDHRNQQMTPIRIHIDADTTFEEALESAHRRFKLQNIAPIERCRLVAYDSNEENIQCSFDGKESERVNDILSNLQFPYDLLLEIRDEDGTFQPYACGEIETKAYNVDINTSDIDGPTIIRVQKTATIGEYKQLLANKLRLNVDDIILAILKYTAYATLLDMFDRTPLSDEDINHKSKVFFAIKGTVEIDKKKFLKIVERSHHIISLYFSLPKTDKETLEKLSIPSYDPNQTSTTAMRPSEGSASAGADVVDAVMNSPPMVQYVNIHAAHNQTHHHLEPESNSEDSSLSDGDRTLVGDVSPNFSSINNSPACSDQHLSSPEDHTKTNGYYNGDDDTDMLDVGQSKQYYFKAHYYEESSSMESDEPVRMLKVLVHNHMIVAKLKRALEPFIRVPMEYFKIFRIGASQTETELTRLTEDLTSFKDGERLNIELGRALRSGEFKCKVHYMKLTETIEDNEKMPYLCDWILCNGAGVGKTKREILAHIASIDSKYDIPYERCRLRKKNGNCPSKIYLDDQKFGDDVVLLQNLQILVQELEDPSQQVTDPEAVTVFLRRWNPAQMTLGPFQELTVNTNEEIKSLIATLSGIPEENVEFTKVNGSFPRSSVSLLDVHSSLPWTSNETTLCVFPLSSTHDGHMYYYRDSTEELKKLTSSERQEMKNQDVGYLNSDATSTTIRRRERALKIYVDSSPKKRDE